MIVVNWIWRLLTLGLGRPLGPRPKFYVAELASDGTDIACIPTNITIADISSGIASINNAPGWASSDFQDGVGHLVLADVFAGATANSGLSSVTHNCNNSTVTCDDNASSVVHGTGENTNQIENGNDSACLTFRRGPRT